MNCNLEECLSKELWVNCLGLEDDQDLFIMFTPFWNEGSFYKYFGTYCTNILFLKEFFKNTKVFFESTIKKRQLKLNNYMLRNCACLAKKNINNCKSCIYYIQHLRNRGSFDGLIYCSPEFIGI
jgi:hypothetical protein